MKAVRRLGVSVLGSIVALVCALSSSAWAADLAVAPLFNNHMVLQRDIQVPVWGTAAPDQEVTVSFAGQTKSVKAGPDGKWMLKLDKLAMSKESRAMTVSSGGKEVKLEDVAERQGIAAADSHLKWPSRNKGLQVNTPAAVGIGGGRRLPIVHLHRDLFTRRGRPPHRHLDPMLQHHVVSEQGRDRHLAVGDRNGAGQAYHQNTHCPAQPAHHRVSLPVLKCVPPPRHV